MLQDMPEAAAVKEEAGPAITGTKEQGTVITFLSSKLTTLTIHYLVPNQGFGASTASHNGRGEMTERGML
jgi:hypothetical protein